MVLSLPFLTGQIILHRAVVCDLPRINMCVCSFCCNWYICYIPVIEWNRILRVLKHKFHPYKIHLVKDLSEDGFDHHLKICEIISRDINNPNFIFIILFPDKCPFFINSTGHKSLLSVQFQSQDISQCSYPTLGKLKFLDWNYWCPTCWSFFLTR